MLQNTSVQHLCDAPHSPRCCSVVKPGQRAFLAKPSPSSFTNQHLHFTVRQIVSSERYQTRKLLLQLARRYRRVLNLRMIVFLLTKQCPEERYRGCDDSQITINWLVSPFRVAALNPLVRIIEESPARFG